MKIIVTGAAGFIGSHLAERLLDAGHDVVGIDCFTDYYLPAIKKINAADVEARGGRIMPLDLAVDDLSEAAEGVEVVFHFAGQPGISAATSYDTYVRNNMTAAYRLLQAVKSQSTLRCFVNIGTSSIYGAHATDTEDTAPKPTSYYGVTKLGAEQLALAYCRDQGMPACSLRLFSVYGERERPEKLYPLLIKSILEDTDFPLFEDSEKHSRSYTYVGDIIDGCVAVLANYEVCIGEVINIGTDLETTTGEGIRIVEEIMGKKANLVLTPKRPGDQLRTHANIAKARRLLNYDPQTTPEVGLAAEVEWYKTKIHGKI